MGGYALLRSLTCFLSCLLAFLLHAVLCANSTVPRSPLAGEFLQDRPTLLISHHRIEGRIVSLPKPLAVLEKKKRPSPQLAEQTQADGKRRNKSTSRTNTSAIDIPSSPPLGIGHSPLRLSHHLNSNSDSDSESESEEQQDPDLHLPASPTTSRKRTRAGDVSLSASAREPRTPSKRKRARPAAAQSISAIKTALGNASATGSAARHRRTPSPSPSPLGSSPVRLAPKNGDALDFSSSPPRPEEEDEDDDEFEPVRPGSRRSAQHQARAQLEPDATDSTPGSGSGSGSGLAQDGSGSSLGLAEEAIARPTSTYYDIVSVVRRKILFAKRPEPVVKLEDGKQG